MILSRISPLTRFWNARLRRAAQLAVPIAAALALTLVVVPTTVSAGQAGDSEVTFTKDVAPILQRSCQNCHRPSSVAPMSLLTYEEARPWARSIKNRTGLRNRMGVMPPWFIEKDVGIQDFKDDISLSEDEITTIAEWVDGGAPRGNPADMPPPFVFVAADEWDIGTPDLIVDSPPITIAADAPDWWGALAPTPTGLTEDRYVAAMQIKEISNVQGGTGGKFVFHHATLSSIDDGDPAGGWPAHEVGRNADIFDPDIGRLLNAGSELAFPRFICTRTVKRPPHICESPSSSTPGGMSQRGSAEASRSVMVSSIFERCRPIRKSISTQRSART